MHLASNHPSFIDYDKYFNSNSSVITYPTTVALPLIAFSTVEAVLFTINASVKINSKILTFKPGDTYEFLNYKRTISEISTNGNIDSIDYNFSNFNLVGRLAPNEPTVNRTSMAKIFTKYYFNLSDYDYDTEECVARLGFINLQNVTHNPISGFDLGVITGKNYLLYLIIVIPFVGNTLDCNIEVHDFITDLASYQKITPSVIYPYKPVGNNGPGTEYIPDTGDNELFVGAT